MILVDTSVWIDHLRTGEATLVGLLDASQVSMHTYVIGELACGSLRNRSSVLDFLHDLPQARIASDTEVMCLIEQHRLMGLGIGYIDAHLLAAALLTPKSSLWTRDRRLAAVAQRLGVCYELAN